LAEYQVRLLEFERAGFHLAAVSVDDPVRSQTVATDLRLTFPLLGDPARTTVEAWGLLNREEKGGIAHPALFIISAEGTVRLRQREGVRTRISPDEALVQVSAKAWATSLSVKSVWPGWRGFLGALRHLWRHGLRTPWTR
jgi:peroxiredoxin